MNNLKKDILDILDNDYNGILWVAEKSLKDYPAPFHTMNYLTDGQISKVLSSHPDISHETPFLFCNNFFNKNFYISYIKASLLNLEETLKNSIEIIIKSKMELTVTKILVIFDQNTDNKNFISNHLNKIFPQIDFKQIYI